MNTDNRINDIIRELRTACNEPYEEGRTDAICLRIPDIILEAEETGDIETCDMESLQLALDLCANNRVISGRRSEVFDYVVDSIQKDSHTDIWLRGIIRVRLQNPDIRRILKSVWFRKLQSIFFPMLEEEVDKRADKALMYWYIELLDCPVNDSIRERAYQRLAFYYMHHCTTRWEIKKAKAYLLALERWGILPENPYKGYYGRYDCSELIRTILDDTYKDNLIRIRTEYARGLLKEVMDNGVPEGRNLEDDLDWGRFTSVVEIVFSKIIRNGFRGIRYEERDLKLWNDFMAYYRSCLKYIEEHESDRKGYDQLAVIMRANTEEWDEWERVYKRYGYWYEKE